MLKQPDWLLWAWRELGVHEVSGNGDNPRVVDMFKDVGHQAIRDDEVAWCAAFLGACLERSGRGSTRSLLARSYLTWGEPIEAAQYGAIAVLSRGTNTALGHVGFVVGESETHLFLLGGNQSNGVNVASYAKERLLSLRWPNDANGVQPGGAGPTTDAEPRNESGKSLFDAGLAHVLEMEGGFSDDPHDPGGPTNKGITLGVYARWTGEEITTATRSRLVARLKRIPDAMVREIYLTRYWQPAQCERMPAAVAMMHFDAAVNHGVTSAARMLQQAVGADVDGEIGPQTTSRLAAKPVAETLLGYAEFRRERYRALQHFWRFGRGWLRRVDRTLIHAGEVMRMPQAADAAGRPDGEIDENIDKGEQRMPNEISANVDDPRGAKWWGESMTIWGVIVTAAATVLPVVGPLIGIDVTGEMVRQVGQQVTEVVQALGGVIGTLMAIYGRVRATQPIARRMVSVKL